MINTSIPLATISIINGNVPVSVSVFSGRGIYVLGRNGTGKSALVHNIG